VTHKELGSTAHENKFKPGDVFTVKCTEIKLPDLKVEFFINGKLVSKIVCVL